MESNDLPDVLEALGALFDLLIRSYGPWGTVLVISLIGPSSILYRYRRLTKRLRQFAETDRGGELEEKIDRAQQDIYNLLPSRSSGSTSHPRHAVAA